jgi:hypothetical protein
MSNVLVGAAIDSLHLIGIDVPPGAISLIELLINEGVDVVSEFPRIIETIERYGGDAWYALEQVAGGFEQYGPVRYIQHEVENYFTPQMNKVREVHSNKYQLVILHQATFAHVRNTLTTLNTSAGFIGSGADVMLNSLTNISTSFHNLTAAMSDAQQIDADLESDIHMILETMIAMAIIDLIIFAAVFVVVFVGSQLLLLVPEVGLAEFGGVSLGLGLGASFVAAAGTASAAVEALLPAEGAILISEILYAFG